MPLGMYIALSSQIQWNHGIKESLGAELLSFGGRFLQISIYSHIT